MKQEKLLIISLSAGAGHVQAAKALCETAELVLPSTEVVYMDMIDHVSKTVRTTVVEGYDKLIRVAPGLWRAIYDAADEEKRKKQFAKVTKMLSRVNARNFYKAVKAVSPDKIICTHSYPAQVLKQSEDLELQNIPLSLVVTDYDVHKFWFVDGVDNYFCATEKSAWKLRQAGKTEVTVSGIPISPVFYQKKDVSVLKKEENILSNVRTILMLSGGYGMVELDKIIMELAESTTEKLQIIAVAGKNEKLKKRLDAIAGRLPKHIALHPIGWTNKMDVFMRIADVIVTKSGGITTTECLALQKPMIVIDPIPGQEERNAEYLLEQGAGVVARSTEDLLYYLEAFTVPVGKIKKTKPAAEVILKARK